MNILESTEDIYSSAQSEFARVVDIHLEWNVDFNKQILEGKAILTIDRKPLTNIIILDDKDLDIIKVTDSITGSLLVYSAKLYHNFESLLTIQLPQHTETSSCESRCKIEIEYRTSENCLALLWLTPEQTADGEHPFLVSTSQYTYARAMFPCQDTPSVKFTYSARISVPMNFKVIMSATLKKVYLTQSQIVHEFVQSNAVPAYGVVIAVGSLEARQLSPRCCVYAETKYIAESVKTFANIEIIYQIAENLYGLPLWSTCDICVLPSNISQGHNIECPNVIFVSPYLLGGDISLIIPLAQYLSQMLIERLVTCVNYDHFWLIKSFSMFFYRKIVNQMPTNEILKEYIMICMNRKIEQMIKKYKDIGMLQSLIPRLWNLLPNHAMEYVPYELGYVLLEQLEHKLGGPSVFEPFLKSYFNKFENKSINTKDWMTFLYSYFNGKIEILNSFDWNMYFFTTELYVPDTSITEFEIVCLNLSDEWIRWDEALNNIHQILDINLFFDVQKIILFYYLLLPLNPAVLTARKLRMMSTIYEGSSPKYSIQFHWLRLCIKNRWKDIVVPALTFAIQFCSLRYACPIFEDLYNWTEMRQIAIDAYLFNESKMLYQTRNILRLILHLN